MRISDWSSDVCSSDLGAGRAPEAEVDPARIQLRQGAELLGDHVGRVVRQHDPAGTDPDAAGSAGDMGDDDRGRRTGDAGHVVMLGHPEAPEIGTGPGRGRGGRDVGHWEWAGYL